MLQSSSSSVAQPTNEGETLTPRRLRHVTGIQIRNITPFPVRDAFTSAITQPADQSHFNAPGTTDDLGTMLSRKRSRKISTASTATRRSLKREEGAVEQDIIIPSEVRGRTTSTSRVTFSNGANTSASPSSSLTLSRSNHSFRGHRPRTSSMTSSMSIHFVSSGPSSTSIAIPPLLPDNSQAALERVIGSRLVETFIVVTIPPLPVGSTSTDKPQSPSTRSTVPLRSAPASKASHSTHFPPLRITTKSPTPYKGTEASNSPNRVRFPPDSAPPTKTSFQAAFQRQDDRTTKPHVPRLNGSTSSNKPLSHGKGKSSSSPLVEPARDTDEYPTLPAYFSSIHRPSTNPFFAIDTRSGRDFPQGCDIGGRHMKIEVWGRMSIPRRTESVSQEERQQFKEDNGLDDWKCLEEWSVDLDKLLPLPDDLDSNPSQLPSNTLVITLLPPGRSYYLPPSIKTLSRSPSPSSGYTSDPESELRKAKKLGQQPTGIESPEVVALSRRRRKKGAENGADAKDTSKTATWQDLFKLVSHQSTILDNQSSLETVVQKIDGLLDEDDAFSLRREVFEREARIRELRNNHGIVLDRIAQKREELSLRSRRFQERAELLSVAGDAIEFDPSANIEIEKERAHSESLRKRTMSAQTSLLSTLSTIFPIELYSPPDLLFTILAVPLPIPIAANEPAPPLTLPDHKDVTDEAVATALGYVAQVVQLLAAYIGKGLIYPVTCVGSRSLIRDGISAMVGPRMFPLFSRGVDTYRFEYGVFLLNKNIEMLMAERDLRALDMRHTLPNLKNLLLTLSHGAVVKPIQPRLTPSPGSSTSGLETPEREPSPTTEDATTPKATHLLPTQFPSASRSRSTSPSASGANTPTAANEDSRKGKSSFLGFVPFTDFLRGRYPSTINAPEKPSLDNDSSADGYSPGNDDSEDAEADEEDRVTIHGVAREPSSEPSSSNGGTTKTS